MAIGKHLPRLFAAQCANTSAEIKRDSNNIAQMLVDRVIVERNHGRKDIASALVDAAMGHCTHAQVAVVVCCMVQQRLVSEWELDLAREFKERMSSLSLDRFFDIWNAIFDRNPRSLDLDALAVTTLIGDLAFNAYIPHAKLTLCLTLLLDNFCALLHLVCIGSLLKKASAAPEFKLDPRFVVNCIERVQDRCEKIFGRVTEEEELVVAHFYGILFRTEFHPPSSPPSPSPSPQQGSPCPSLTSDSGISASSFGSLPSIADAPITRRKSQKSRPTRLLTVTLPTSPKSNPRSRGAMTRPRSARDPSTGKRDCCQFSYGSSPPPEEFPPLPDMEEQYVLARHGVLF